jgi:hypothetical protein
MAQVAHNQAVAAAGVLTVKMLKAAALAGLTVKLMALEK